ncbi:DUF4230 domain-containing protein [Pseudarthrobacter sp. MDT3-28]|uniref:DUF4230 domain-containing protein n=1 Tax=Pseudarthrobacter raffinosi TaxID=2953651 RepID=UPI00208F70AA|nr:DUF4230 domain-containing protein [Pseudarthrobacter sp. MDT3-28]MCO4239489.1 DUF4230 domain-containing protein [Pseudarthrobacter sp. MDT3-28]
MTICAPKHKPAELTRNATLRLNSPPGTRRAGTPIGTAQWRFKEEKEPMIGKLIKGIALVVVGALVALTLTGIGVVNVFGSNPFQTSQTDRSQPALLKSIKDVSQYHAAVGNFEVVIDIEDEGVEWIPDIIAGRRTLFVAAGTVNTYVDLGLR